MARFGAPYLPFALQLADPVKALWGEGTKVLFCLAAFAVCVVYGRRHARRLQEELYRLA